MRSAIDRIQRALARYLWRRALERANRLAQTVAGAAALRDRRLAEFDRDAAIQREHLRAALDIDAIHNRRAHASAVRTAERLEAFLRHGD